MLSTSELEAFSKNLIKTIRSEISSKIIGPYNIFYENAYFFGPQSKHAPHIKIQLHDGSYKACDTFFMKLTSLIDELNATSFGFLGLKIYRVGHGSEYRVWIEAE